MPSDSRGRLCWSGKSRVAAGTGRAVDKGGVEFAGSRGWFVGKCEKVGGDVLHVVVLVVVMRDVARLDAWGFPAKNLGSRRPRTRSGWR